MTIFPPTAESEAVSECHQAPLRLHTHYGQDGEMLWRREECTECKQAATAWTMAR